MNIEISSRIAYKVQNRPHGGYLGRDCVWEDTLVKIEEYAFQSSISAKSLAFACQAAAALESKLLRTGRLVKTLKIEFRPALSQNEDKGLVMEVEITLTNPLDTENDLNVAGTRVLKGALGASREVPGFSISTTSADQIAVRLLEQIQQALRTETEKYARIVQSWQTTLEELKA